MAVQLPSRIGLRCCCKLGTPWPTPSACAATVLTLLHARSRSPLQTRNATNPSPARSYSSLTDKATGVTVPLATLGRRLGAAKAPGAAPPPRVVFVFGEHCREVITSEVGLWLGRLLADEHSHVRQWPELHEALERAGEAPAGGGADGSSSAAWPMTVDAWASELLEQLSIQVRWWLRVLVF